MTNDKKKLGQDCVVKLEPMLPSKAVGIVVGPLPLDAVSIPDGPEDVLVPLEEMVELEEELVKELAELEEGEAVVGICLSPVVVEGLLAAVVVDPIDEAVAKAS